MRVIEPKQRDIAKPRVLVHLHCTHPEHVSGMLRRLSRLESLADLQLVATVPKSVMHGAYDVERLIAGFSGARLREVSDENYGVAMFAQVLAQANLDEIDYVLRLTAMGDEMGAACGGCPLDDVTAWQPTLLGALITTPTRFSRALAALAEPGVGMVGAATCITGGEKETRAYYLQRVNDELTDIDLPAVEEIRYVAGGMFLARARELAPLAHYEHAEFGSVTQGVTDYTLAQVVERLCGALVMSQGLEVRGLAVRAPRWRHESKSLVDGASEIAVSEEQKEGKKPEDSLTLLERIRRKHRFLHEGRDVIASSEYFDAAWYQRTYPEVGNVDPAVDYLERGWREGRDPSPLFHNDRYLAKHRGCKRMGCNPLLHWECYGKYGDRGIGDAPDVKKLARRDVISNSVFFDAEWYLKNNLSLKNSEQAQQSDFDPAMHYLTVGGRTNMDPSPAFCSDEYLSLNPDVRKAGTNPLYHYLTNGFVQGRAISALDVHEPSFPEGAISCSREYGVRSPQHHRTAVVATYTEDGRIDDAFIYLLRGLSDVVDNVVLVGDCPLFEEELDKLEGLVTYALYERHGQYDFGSYKRGLKIARRLGLLEHGDVDELVMMNDSCYGPVYPFARSFDYVYRNISCDFWGYNSGKNRNSWFICSFFYVFRRKIIDSGLLDEFFRRVRGNLSRGVAVSHFEVELSRVLISQGMRGHSYFNWSGARPYNHRYVLSGLIHYRIPLVKKKSIRSEAKDNVYTAFAIIERDNPELYALMDKTQCTYWFHPTTLADYRMAQSNTLARVQKRMLSGEPVRSLFLVTDAAMFPGRPLLDLMLATPGFDARVIVVPDTRHPDEMDAGMVRCAADLACYATAGVLETAWRDRYGNWRDVTDDADIVCYPFPHNVSSYNYNVRYAMGRDFLPIIFNCGYYRSLYDREVMGLYNYAYYWKVFVECEENLAEYREYSELEGANASLVGYVKMDRLARFERRSHERPRILVALHHSVDGGYNPELSLANFVRYHEYFLNLPDKYPIVDFVYRPHPALMRALGRFAGWNTKRVNKYTNELRAKPNVTWSDGGDYFQEFADSDACIQDCGSFLVEYLYTGKPCCYMLKDPSDIEAKFAPLGKACLEQCYLSYSTADIDEFIDNVVLGGNDPKAEGRAELAKHVMLNYPHAAEAALGEICSSILGDGE